MRRKKNKVLTDCGGPAEPPTDGSRIPEELINPMDGHRGSRWLSPDNIRFYFD